jgi:transcriptional regulator with XRE-family HTH domain
MILSMAVTDRLPSSPLGEAVLKKRGQRNLRIVAGELKISHQTVLNVERGDCPRLYTFVALMRWLGVPPKDWHVYLRGPFR